MGNVRSLPNKMDELAALTRHQREYRECSLLLFTETWLTALTPDTAAELDGFTLLRADRSKESGKRKGGGLAVFVNDRWCNPGHITVKEQHCCKDIELLAVSMRPYYLPREFTHALVVVVQPAVTRTVKKWSEEAEEALKDCFNTTLWDVFSDAHGEDIDSLTHCLTDYINFCVENTVPTRTVRSFSDSKPWITPDIKALLKEKRRAFVSGNKEELKSVQRELRRMIRKGKNSYRRKMEHQLQQNNICGVWKGLKTISGLQGAKVPACGRPGLTPTRHFQFSHCPAPLSPINTSLLQPAPHITPDQLCGIFGYTFNLRPEAGESATALEDVLHRPSAKDTAPQGAQQLQAGSSDVSSDEDALERLVLAHLRPLVSSFMDPLQFAYQPDIEGG
ncbi:hypothetical protein L3Q82_004127 [Scortum barcoo]|uniref:Uncharacterized protein n=1 Tax=Scortum barcoo TaxID=214431 RepID=A0ACB8X7Y5_9TELE|nr:hypothetical protein L3Q82_004127 [Scortum barcoo]